MKPVCPCCQSSTVYEMTDGTHNRLCDELLSPAALIGFGVSLCKSFRVHPAVGVIAGTALAAVIEIAQVNTVLPMLLNTVVTVRMCLRLLTNYQSLIYLTNQI